MEATAVASQKSRMHVYEYEGCEGGDCLRTLWEARRHCEKCGMLDTLRSRRKRRADIEAHDFNRDEHSISDERIGLDALP